MSFQDTPAWMQLAACLGGNVQAQSSAVGQGATAAAGALTGTGMGVVALFNSTATPGTYTTRTAAQMIADANLVQGQQWLLLIGNQGTGTLTLAAGSNVNLAGTTTVLANQLRIYNCYVNSISGNGLITITGLIAVVFTGGFTMGA